MLVYNNSARQIKLLNALVQIWINNGLGENQQGVFTKKCAAMFFLFDLFGRRVLEREFLLRHEFVALGRLVFENRIAEVEIAVVRSQ